MDIELTDEDRINLLMKHACELFPGPNQHIIVGVTPDLQNNPGGECTVSVCCEGDHGRFALILQQPAISSHRTTSGN